MTNKILSDLHDNDFNRWTEEIKLRIQKREFGGMDWENLIAEIEDMGASQKRALDSYTQRLIEHILKLNHWHSELEYCRNGWQKEVANFRISIKRILRKNPSLKNYLAEEYEKIFQDAVYIMSFDFKIPENNFVELDTILDENYFGY